MLNPNYHNLNNLAKCTVACMLEATQFVGICCAYSMGARETMTLNIWHDIVLVVCEMMQLSFYVKSFGVPQIV